MPSLSALKRAGRHQQALRLALQCVAAAEAEQDVRVAHAELYDRLFGEGPEHRSRATPPAYTEQAAILYRKLGMGDEEIAVIERWMARYDGEQQCAVGAGRLAHRLTAARESQQRSRGRAGK